MRGTGKTTRLLKATPVGGMFVIQNKAVFEYIKHWINASGRADDYIDVVPMDRIHKYRGLSPRPITIDHCVLDSLDLYSDEEQQAFMIATSMAPYIIYCDEEGDVVTNWNVQ